MHRNRRVKILATLGPSSNDRETISALFKAGADVFRINMSHADHKTLKHLVALIREIEKEASRPIGILCDLQGPKHRLGTFAEGRISVTPGQKFSLDDNPQPGTADRVQLPHPEILSVIQPGDRILIDDGRVQLKAINCVSGTVTTEVIAGTHLSDRKGVSLPDTEIVQGSMTSKDRRDLEEAISAEVDWVALSFVQRPEDLAEVRKIARGRVGVLAKIEKPQAIERLDQIIEISDAIMVARGDLGVEMPLEAVPGIQKQITRKCRKAGKPVVIATQMLESMISAPVPTRAEVSDVATAVYEGADAIMLSAESAAGKYPVEAVATMNSIAEHVERDPNYRMILTAQRPEAQATGADAISLAAREIAETLELSAIICFTASGATGLRAARERPSRPIVTLSPLPRTARRLALVWGLHCVVTEDARDLDDVVDRACRIAVAEGYAAPGDRVIITAGVPLRTPGSTNMLRIAYIASDGMSGI
jgi:pyruvate kinase